MEIIVQTRKRQPLLPCKIIVNNFEINEEKLIGNQFKGDQRPK